MRIKALLFAGLAEEAGTRGETLELPGNPTIRDVWLYFRGRNPGLEAWEPTLRFAVNQEFCGAETALHPDDEVALLPPVSGG